MRRYIDQHGIQLVHAYDVPTTQFGVPAAKFSKARAVVSSQLGYRDLFTNVDRRILRVTDRLVDRIHVNCEAMRRHLIDDEGVPAERIHLCYNGVDTAVFFPREQPKPELLSGAEVVVGTVCALRQEKRVDLLIEAFAAVRHLRPGLKLLVVGSGPLLESLQSKAASLGVLEQSVFVPATSDVADWMRAIDIYVLPSDSEAFSNALLEAMASGCCPIGSRVGGTPEQIDDGQNGFLFEKGDAGDFARKLEWAITDTNRRKQMASAAAASARQRFSLGRAADVMGGLYKSLLQFAGASRSVGGAI
jgi:glycosyltransferase involved in cell wall biosynthesis